VTDLATEFETHRRRLFGLAYRLLGSGSEAEDAVQNTYLRLHAADRSVIRSLPAWLTKALTNLCLKRADLRARPSRKLCRPGVEVDALEVVEKVAAQADVMGGGGLVVALEPGVG
jgi:DNA-directed RNA polymerase specialized sigma24 family protein